MSSKKDYAWYRAALVGATNKRPGDYAGLRSYANGFDPASGYDLSKFDQWTPSQKAKITRYFDAVKEVTGRPNIIFRPRNESHLRTAQRATQHPEKIPLLKVAFLPYTPPISSKGIKSKERPKVKFRGDAIEIEGPYHLKRFIPFDPLKLIADPTKEVFRAAREGRANYYTIQAGANEISSGGDAMSMSRRVIELMHKYDGIKTLPKGSGNKGDAPAAHHYKKWLIGINAYKFKPGGDPRRLGVDMERARLAKKRRELSARRRKKK